MGRIADPVAHQLKILPKYFQAVSTGDKRFELRSTKDRTFEEGQNVQLREWDDETKEYTGNWIIIRITFVINEYKGLLCKNACVFGFVVITRGKDDDSEN